MVNSSLNERNQKRKIRKICMLSVSIIITAIILITETYAWFVGLSTVSVSDMQIKISSADGLELSLDAATWQSSTLTISQQAVTTGLNSSYNSHKNKWPTSGLVPISTSGDVSSPGVINLYGKSSLASTAGGYKIISSKISNVSGSTISEGEGYVAFDLFIRNGRNGSLYNVTDYTDTMGESIYLSTTSSATVSSAGSATNNGIANSVRVAFARIGMVSGSSNAATAQGINCSGSTSVTSLCTIASTVIWEPNDKAHDTNLIDYYNNKACKKRTGTDNYSGACNELSNNTFFPTYTVKKAISAGNNVNIYDGAEINTYAASATNGFIQNTVTFTDTKKNISGDARPVFFNLAANSITKVRVYIYLEGQDVDNYDLITKGQSINIKFGFTKDKFNVSA